MLFTFEIINTVWAKFCSTNSEYSNHCVSNGKSFTYLKDAEEGISALIKDTFKFRYLQ